MQIIDGKALSSKIRAEISAQVAELKSKGVEACLAVILVGNDPSSELYVRNKVKASEEVGIKSILCRFPLTVNEKELIDEIERLNADDTVSGILVQLPLPNSIDEKKVTAHIDVNKDVDGFSAYQTGLLCLGTPDLAPCTPQGIIALIESTGVESAGKHAVIVGRSNIVGRPTLQLLLQRDATVTICHSKTRNLKEFTKTADILVVAVGKPRFITKDMVKDGAVVIDVGISRDENGKLSGDVDFENVKDVCSFITPVPGGVGPMTVTMLMRNTLLAAKNRHNFATF